MTVLVAYMSQTGNTRKVAEAIFETIEAVKEIKALAELGSLEGYDLAFIGFPLQGGQPAGEAKNFLERHGEGRSIAIFVTHASPEGRLGIEECLGKCKAAAIGANVLGVFDCQGELSEVIADFMSKSGDPELAEAARRRSATIGQPDAARLERARVWAKKVLASYSSDRV